MACLIEIKVVGIRNNKVGLGNRLLKGTKCECNTLYEKFRYIFLEKCIYPAFHAFAAYKDRQREPSFRLLLFHNFRPFFYDVTKQRRRDLSSYKSEVIKRNSSNENRNQNCLHNLKVRYFKFILILLYGNNI